MEELDLMTFKMYNDYYPIYVFFIVTISIHLLVVIFPKTRMRKKSWVKLDYIYYLFAAVGIFSLFSESQKNIADYEIRKIIDPSSQSFYNFNARVSNVEHSAYTLQQMIDSNFNDNKEVKIYQNYLRYLLKNIEQLRKNELERLNNFYYKNKTTSLIDLNMTRSMKRINGYEYFISRNYLKIAFEYNPFKNEQNEQNICINILGADHTEWCDGTWVTGSKELVQDIKILKKTYAELSYLKGKHEKSDFDWFMLLFGPYLLAIAFGIRISKISAELIGFKKT